MRTITGTIPAFIPNRFISVKDLLSRSPDDSLGSLAYFKKSLDTDWIACGTAQITVTFDDDEKVVAGMVDALKAEKQKIIADANVKAMQIDERIQSLLALPAPVQD